MPFQKVSGSQISNFFYCQFEKENHIPINTLRPSHFGKILENAYSLILNNKPRKDVLSIVAEKLVKIPNININDLKKLSYKIYKSVFKISKRGKNKIVATNLIKNDENFCVEIDQFCKNNNNFFPREVKSYKSPSIYAWNSNIMQLTTQCVVLENYYGINVRYGEIVYLGNCKIVPLDTYLLREALYTALERIIQGQDRIVCELCTSLKLNKCSF